MEQSGQMAGGIPPRQSGFTAHPPQATRRLVPTPPPPSGRAVNIAAAVVAVALVAGLGFWGYGQIQRDVSGVPIVRALEGPMRVAPEDPGGQVADHAGLSVNGVQAAGAAAAPADRIALAPPTTRLAEEDQTQEALRRQQEALAQDSGTEDAGSLEDGTHDAVARALALAEKLTEGAVPLTDVTDLSADPSADPNAAAAPAEPEALPKVVVLGPGPTRSPRPAPRPALPKAGIVDTSAPPNGVRELEQVDAGTRLVQLGAFDTPDLAREAWRRIDGAVTGILVDKSRLIQQAEAGGRTFWRLRVHGFTDLSEARRFCAAVSVASNDCIPVVAR